MQHKGNCSKKCHYCLEEKSSLIHKNSNLNETSISIFHVKCACYCGMADKPSQLASLHFEHISFLDANFSFHNIFVQKCSSSPSCIMTAQQNLISRICQISLIKTVNY